MSPGRIRLLLLDVDGVLTDGSIWIDKDGDEIKKFHARDGLAIKMLQNSGIEVGIITGRSSSALLHRLRDLKVDLIHHEVDDKLVVYERILDRLGVEDHEVAYMGDDLPDIPVLKRVALPAAPADAVPEVLEICTFHSRLGGGYGAVRELAQFILKSKNVEEREMEVESIFTDRAPAPIGPYSQALKVGNLLFLSGQIAIDGKSGEVVKNSFANQCRLVLDNVRAVLQAAGGSMQDLVKVNVYLTNMDNFAQFNEIYAEYLEGHKPARACVEVSRLPKGVDVEVEAVARVKG